MITPPEMIQYIMSHLTDIEDLGRARDTCTYLKSHASYIMQKRLIDVIGKESSMVIVVGPNGSGKSTYVQKIVKPYKYRYTRLPTYEDTTDRTSGYTPGWGVTEEKVLVCCWEDYYNLSDLYNLSTLLQLFKDGYDLWEPVLYHAPRRMKEASVILMMKPEDYEICKKYLKSHYLATLDKAYNVTVQKASNTRAQYFDTFNYPWISLYSRNARARENSMHGV